MNKQAAEKIATEYYNYGIQLALQQAGIIKSAETTWQQRAGGTKTPAKPKAVWMTGKTPNEKAEEADTFNWLKDMQAQGS